MTSNNLHNKIKTRILLALTIIALVCFSMFFSVACKKSTEETTTKPSYTYTDVDDGLISNPSFNIGTADLGDKSLPLTTATGWTRSKDSTGSSSSSKSGIIELSEEGWIRTMEGLYTDSAYLKFLKSEFKFSKEDAIKLIKIDKGDDSYKPTNEEIKDKVVKEFMLKNVSKPDIIAGADNKVYMLNNYTSNISWGASQKITSSKEVTVKKGEISKITVSLLTQNLSGLNENYGASIRILASYNGTNQADYVIANIDTNGVWESYTIYVNGDTEQDITYKLSLGLGYNLEYQTQGTVYFDEIKVESASTLPADKNQKTFTFAEKEPIIIDASETGFNKTNLVYDLTLANDTKFTAFSQAINPYINGDYTKSNNDDSTSQDKGWTSSASYNNGVVTLDKASYTLTVKPSATEDFKVENEQYLYVSFYLKNNLNKFSGTDIYFDVVETTQSQNKKYAEIGVISETTEDLTQYGIIIFNRFPEDVDNTDRTFYIQITIGPNKISTTDLITEYATGTVEIKDFKIATGSSNRYDENDNETENYAYYDLFTDIAIGSTSLFAGYDSDYNESDPDDIEEVGFDVSAIDLENIKTRPVVPRYYDGVIPNHIYLKNDETAATDVNTRTTGTANNSYAGVINSKTQYTGLKADLLADGEQALMIYNANSDEGNYGYISMNGSKSIAVSSYAKVSVKVKVLDGANAFIYLVDTSSKDIMSFVDFKPNTTGLNKIPSKDQVKVLGSNNLFEIMIDGDDMINRDVDGDGWVDVEFYIATGNKSKSFRIELWNGDRTGTTPSIGYALFKDVEVNTELSSFEPSSFTSSFIGTDNPLANAPIEDPVTDYYCYVRELTDKEIEYNKEYPEKAITYSSKIVWAKTNTMVYAVFNNLQYTEVDPYASIKNETETTEEQTAGCKAKTDPASFWLSFSSILLSIVLVGAIIMLFVKKHLRKRKANASDAKSHYTVKSRVRKVRIVEEVAEENASEEQTEEVENSEETEVVEETEEESTEYIYGEVQDFGNEKDDEKND